ncbi:hypothetical protein [Streptantibioticus ferralitis]|uniref:Uncharacterized protein n=1 Tax=Streptantibioticus ferralitis TaxID=236510 RepID=A0ABT5YU92_9ACTN|nr:hypothetical protein [Streptantibioticus ferralitis]MDF2255033.1 hypothetical protein [Streptantibioticus ferralitis]
MARSTPHPDSSPYPHERPPANWPGSVRPPGSPGFEQSAKNWLFDLAPARWWHEESLHRHPVELASMVRLWLEADVHAMQTGLRGLTESLSIREAASELYTHERDWARAMLEQVKLVEECLRSTLKQARKRPMAHRTKHIPLPRPRPAAG